MMIMVRKRRRRCNDRGDVIDSIDGDVVVVDDDNGVDTDVGGVRRWFDDNMVMWLVFPDGDDDEDDDDDAVGVMLA